MRGAGSGIGSVDVKKADLIRVLRANAEGHNAVYRRAIEAYREKAIEALDGLLEQVKDGVVAQLYVSLPVPEDHSTDYWRAINMLVMHQGDTITLTEDAYRKLVDDEWEWSAHWHGSTAAYTNGGIQ